VTPTPPEAGNNPPKKLYEAPRLEVYGNIQQITRATGTAGHGDGGAHPMNKTQ
jgi:hypothetical protein